MIDNYYDIYISKCMALAETLVIKSVESVDGLNEYVNDYSAMHGTDPVDTLNPRSWKYYLNISGEYHPLDTVMTVVSLDTLEIINFTKENLLVHTATAEGYQYGTRLYNVLVEQYPTQEMLIKGILYPVDIDLAINSVDGTILGYPDYLVEENEYSLISKLQSWIFGFKTRWINKQFSISDVLYPATSLGIMYINLVPTILNYRLEACKTNEAHSYHIRQYLASHGLLHVYIDNMTLKQALFFYRNICYIERNSGKKNIFTWLIENILTVRNLPIAEYIMKHELDNILTNIYPDIAFYNNPLNTIYNISTVNNKYSLDEILLKEDVLAKDNLKYKDTLFPVIKEKMENSLSNVLKTKVLESSAIIDDQNTPYSLNEVLLNHWLYLSTSNIYTAYINITNPKTNITISLNAKDAFILAWYAFCTSININPINIPKVSAIRVQRVVPNTNIVSINDLMSVVDNTRIDTSIGVKALSMQPNINTIISVQAFHNLCVEIHDAMLMQRKLIAYQELSITRAMVANMVNRIYSDNICNLVDSDTTYADWLSSNNIDIDNLSKSQLSTLYNNIFIEATGLSLNKANPLTTMQKAMLNMLSQLSSYSIQIIKSNNTSSLLRTYWTSVRLDKINNKVNSIIDNDFNVVDVSNIKTIFHSEYEHIVVPYSNFVKVNLKTISNFKLTLKKLLVLNPIVTDRKIRVNFLGIRPNYTLPVVNNPYNVLPVLGLDSYLSLTTNQIQSLKDIYNNYSVDQ